MDFTSLISPSVSPVAFISACGLLSLALYNRQNAILTRVRDFQRQKFEILTNPHRSHAREQQDTMLLLIDSQVEKVTAKARLIQTGLCCLLFAVAAFLLSSLTAVATVLYGGLAVVAGGLHVLGLTFSLAAICWALRELTTSLVPLEEETEFLAVLAQQRPAPLNDGPTIKVADIA